MPSLTLTNGMRGGRLNRGSCAVWGLAHDRGVQFRPELMTNVATSRSDLRRPAARSSPTAIPVTKEASGADFLFTCVRNCARELQHLDFHKGGDGGRVDLHSPHTGEPGRQSLRSIRRFAVARSLLLRLHGLVGSTLHQSQPLAPRPCADGREDQEQAEQCGQNSNRQP